MKNIKVDTNFVSFTDRKNLEKIFKEWCKLNNIPKTLFNLITFLQVKDLLNTENIKKIRGVLDE